jgi:hypothetical protein
MQFKNAIEYSRPETKTQKNKNRESKLVPLLILVALIYVFFTYDLESVMKNKRLNDNIAYIKSKVLDTVD